MTGDRLYLPFFLHWGLEIAFTYQKFCWAPAAADKHISLSPPPSLFLIFSSLLSVIPLPHLSSSPLLAGDSSAATLAKPLVEKAERLQQLSLTCYLLVTPKGGSALLLSPSL